MWPAQTNCVIFSLLLSFFFSVSSINFIFTKIKLGRPGLRNHSWYTCLSDSIVGLTCPDWISEIKTKTLDSVENCQLIKTVYYRPLFFFFNVNMSFVCILAPRALFPSFEKRPGNEVALFALPYRVFSHDVTAAILVSQNNETAAMLVSQTNPMGVELFMQTLSFVSINLHRCWPREWKHSIRRVAAIKTWNLTLDELLTAPISFITKRNEGRA